MSNASLRNNMGDASPIFSGELDSKAKNRDALISDLYNRYRMMLGRFISNRFGRFLSEQEVEDVSQETYLTACRLDGLQDIKNPRAYLLKTAINLALDVRRRKQVRTTAHRDLAYIGSLCQSGTTPEQIACDREELKVLYRCICDLPPKCRHVFILHRLRGWSQKRISEYLEMSPEAVGKQIYRALKRCEVGLEEFSRRVP